MPDPRCPAAASLALVVALLAHLSSGTALAADTPQRSAPTPVLPAQDAYPHVAADGRVVFQSNRAGGWKLFVSQLDGSGLRQITTGPSEDVTPRWSPDGRHIIYASTRDDDEDLWIVDPDGGNARNVTNSRGNDSHPGWSPDGREIVFNSVRGDGEHDDIYVASADGSGVKRVTNNGETVDTFPAFTADGGRIVFRRSLRAETGEGAFENSEIMIMNRDGGDVTNLTRSGAFDGWPAPSPDGRRIAFASNRDDPYQVYVMDVDGSEPTRVVVSPYTDLRPQWLPDGSGLVFNREREDHIELWQVKLPAK